MKIGELNDLVKQHIALTTELKEFQPIRITFEDQEDISDAFQQKLEEDCYVSDLRDSIKEIESILRANGIPCGRPLEPISEVKVIGKIDLTDPKQWKKRQLEIQQHIEKAVDIEPDGCPICGDYEGSPEDCPNGCIDQMRNGRDLASEADAQQSNGED